MHLIFLVLHVLHLVKSPVIMISWRSPQPRCVANGTVIINIKINIFLFSLGISNFQICPTFFFFWGWKWEIPRLPRWCPICFPGPYHAFSQCSKIRIDLWGAVARWTWGINLRCTSCTSYDVPNCHRLHIYIYYINIIYIYCIYIWSMLVIFMYQCVGINLWFTMDCGSCT